MSKFTVDQYHAAGCELALLTSSALFQALHFTLAGQLCDRQCAYYAGGRCKALKTLTNPVVETVREEAARLGVSISEVRRQRAARIAGEPA